MPASPPPEFVLASRNAGKLRELSALLAPRGAQLRLLSEFTDASAAETGDTFEANALIKARHAAAIAKRAAIADDSGLAVDALDGAPGVRSARFAGDGASDVDNNQLLLARLQDRPESERGAAFICVIAMVRGADDPDPLLVRGTWRGRIARAPRGANGFGYDPLFLVGDGDRTSAELPPDEKNRISHRAIAAQQLLEAWRG